MLHIDVNDLSLIKDVVDIWLQLCLEIMHCIRVKCGKPIINPFHLNLHEEVDF